jgi:hypothetical protein
MRENKFKVQTSAGEVMAGVFWDSEGNLARGIPEERCHSKFRENMRKLKKLKHRNGSFKPNRQMYQARILPTVPVWRPPSSIFLGP